MFIDKQLIDNILAKSYNEGFLSLNLSYCDLREVPFFLFERPILIKQKDKDESEHEEYKNLDLEKVESLNLSNNYLLQIDTKISCFKGLEILDISNNKLEQLPRQICELGNLKTFIANNNPLVKLPQKFAAFQTLEILDLSDTNIYEIPNSISI